MKRYLIDQQVNKEEGPTHTSMMGGLYKIKPSERDKFWSVYFNHTITEANDSFLTEKHQEKFSKVFVDIDLRHDSEDQEPYAGQRNYLDVVRSGSGLG